MMELIERFIQAEGITLTDEQKELVLENYQRLIVPDIDNLSNERILQVFVTAEIRNVKQQEFVLLQSVRLWFEFEFRRHLWNIRSAEKKKFGEHFRMHIRKDRQKVLDVRLESGIHDSLLRNIMKNRFQLL